MVQALRKRLRLVVATLTVCLTVPSIIAIAAVDTRPTTAKAEAWAESNAKNLPNTLAQIAAYPVEYQKAALRLMTPEERSSLWRARIAQIVATNRLTSDQQLLLLRVAAAWSPDAFRDGADLTQVHALCKETNTSLKPEVARMLSSLGGSDEPAQEGSFIRLARTAQRFIGVYEVQASSSSPKGGFCCNCNVGSICDCTGGYCQDMFENGCTGTGGSGCPGSWPQCGCGGFFPCNGFCIPIPQ